MDLIRVLQVCYEHSYYSDFLFVFFSVVADAKYALTSRAVSSEISGGKLPETSGNLF